MLQVHPRSLTARPWKMMGLEDDPFLLGFGIFWHHHLAKCGSSSKCQVAESDKQKQRGRQSHTTTPGSNKFKYIYGISTRISRFLLMINVVYRYISHTKQHFCSRFLSKIPSEHLSLAILHLSEQPWEVTHPCQIHGTMVYLPTFTSKNQRNVYTWIFQRVLNR